MKTVAARGFPLSYDYTVLPFHVITSIWRMTACVSEMSMFLAPTRQPYTRLGGFQRSVLSLPLRDSPSGKFPGVMLILNAHPS